jgi:hypothetical protein
MASRFLVLRGRGAPKSAKKMSKLLTSVRSNLNRRTVQLVVDDVLKPLKVGTVSVFRLENAIGRRVVKFVLSGLKKPTLNSANVDVY